MRHQNKTAKLGRTAEHRKALLANQVCSLIEHQRIKTTLAKAKAVRPTAVKKFFDEIAPRSTDRKGGYTRIVKLGQRKSDSASMAFIEWVDAAKVVEEKPVEEKKAKRKETEPKPKQKEPAAKQKEPTPAA